MSVPEIILSQLGGNKFIVMTGARDLVGSKDSLKMKLPKNGSKANYLKITLMGDDTYTMEFMKYSPGRFYKKTASYTEPKWEVLKTYNGIYYDQLTEIFEQYTKMYTKLF